MKLKDVVDLIENGRDSDAKEVLWNLNSDVEDKGLAFFDRLSDPEVRMLESLILSSVETVYEMKMSGSGDTIGAVLDAPLMRDAVKIIVKMSIGYALNELEK